MTVFPLLVNASKACAPQLPPREEMPPKIRRAIEILTPFERRLSQEELVRCVIKIFSLSHSLFPEISPECLSHFATTRFDTAHAFSLHVTSENRRSIIVHFNKAADGQKNVQERVTISLALEIIHGSKFAWITPTGTEPSAIREFTSQFPILRTVSGYFPGIISSLCLREVSGKRGPKPAMLQPYGECDLWEYIHAKRKPNVSTFLERIDHISKDNLIFSVMFSLFKGLVIIHTKKIIHNDVKPDNILLFFFPKSNRIEAQFIDFDCSVAAEEGPYLSEPHGTYRYLPPDFYRYAELSHHKGRLLPERFTGDFDGHTLAKDIWSLGHVFYQLICDLQIEPTSEIFQDMIEHVESDEYPPFLMHLREQGDPQALIAWMLHPNPCRRPTAQEALAGFEEILREATE